MRALYLDYKRSDPTRHRAGMGVLALAVAVIAVMGMHYLKLSAQAEQLDEQVAKAERKLNAGRSSASAAGADSQHAAAEIKAANEAILQLTLPWTELFNALESANSSNIALLGLEPDARKRFVRVSGEAKNSTALFAYIRLLQANKTMTSVYLKHQQVQEQNPEKPIRFTLDASWT
jgi:Tfp pilus assembly protein PilN